MKTDNEIIELEKKLHSDLTELEGIRASLSVYDIALHKLPDDAERTPEEEEKMLKERALLLDKYAELQNHIAKTKMELAYFKSKRK